MFENRFYCIGRSYFTDGRLAVMHVFNPVTHEDKFVNAWDIENPAPLDYDVQGLWLNLCTAGVIH